MRGKRSNNQKLIIQTMFNEDVKIGDAELTDPNLLEELITTHVVERCGLPDPRESDSITKGLDYIRESLAEITEPPYEFDAWVHEMLRAMQADSRMLKAILGRVFSSGWMRGDQEIVGHHFPELGDKVTGGLLVRLGNYIDRFFPLNRRARAMTHTIYRDHLDYVPRKNVDGVTFWEVFHRPTGLIIENMGIDSEKEATLYIKQYPVLADMFEEGEK